MKISITPDDDLIKRFGNQLGALSERDGHKALARAVNRTTNTVHGRVIRSVVQQSSIPRQIVKQQVSKQTVKPGSGNSLEGVIFARGNPIPLKEFKAKQFSYGVKAKVWGKQRKFVGMFIFAGTYRSGKSVANGHVFQRVTTAGLPIELQRGPAVPSELVRNNAKEEFTKTVKEMLPQRVQHELGRLLP